MPSTPDGALTMVKCILHNGKRKVMKVAGNGAGEGGGGGGGEDI